MSVSRQSVEHIDQVLGGVEWGAYLNDPELVAVLPQDVAGYQANSLHGAFVTAGLRNLNPKNPPPGVLAVREVIALLRARAAAPSVVEVEFEVVEEPEPTRAPRRRGSK